MFNAFRTPFCSSVRPIRQIGKTADVQEEHGQHIEVLPLTNRQLFNAGNKPTLGRSLNPSRQILGTLMQSRKHLCSVRCSEFARNGRAAAIEGV